MKKNNWKYKIAKQIVLSYIEFKKSSKKKSENCIMSNHIFENVVIKELLWHATTMIEGRKVVSRGKFKGEYINNTNEMINIKIVGQRYWTKDAMEKYKKNNKEEKDYKIIDGLVHEHAVPRNIIKKKIIDKLESIDSYDDECINNIFNIIRDLSKSVVVSKAEDEKLNKAGLRQKMPEKWDGKDWKARYKMKEIKIYKINKEDHNKDFKKHLLSTLNQLNK